jgi:hypothetical protein
MKQYTLTCSTDGINIDYETTIESETEPNFWDCYHIARAQGCEFFSLCE